MPLYLPLSVQGLEPRYITFSTWIDHLPFGYDIVAAAKPRRLVELGVYRGLSYFIFCQAVQEQGLDTHCYAVDTWKGDDHTLAYGEDIWETVDSHNKEHYTGFSTLLRMTFNDALPRFDDESADLIHLDGLHTYEAVKEDFNNWYPKLRPGGLFLFHDVRARVLPDFGVWRFWDELERSHEETFAFNHSFGLGVLRKPGGDRANDPPLLRLLFDPHATRQLRAFYVHASRYTDLVRKRKRNLRIKKQGQQRKIS